jgi:TRAP-type uncharacterized transport system substrate-binding protein
LSADVPSFGVTAILMTTASMDSRVVAEFAKSLTSQIDALKKRHPVLETLTEQSAELLFTPRRTSSVSRPP